MATPTPAAAVACLWCDHTETGDGCTPHEAIEAHQADVHGRRKQPCGCQYVPNGCGSPLSHWWTCDTHSGPRIKQITALQLANDALAKVEENYNALSLKGIIQAFDVSPEEGIKTIEKSIAINPAYVQADFDMAMAQKLGKHYDESIRYFQKVLDKDPKNTWSWYGIATNYADKRDKAKALEYLKKAVDLDPQNVKPQAAAQDHFQWLHGDPDFQNLVK